MTSIFFATTRTHKLDYKKKMRVDNEEGGEAKHMPMP
jgi:hypothetical protein